MENVKRSDAWRNKSVDLMNDAEINGYYLDNVKPEAILISNGLVYVELETFWFPSWRNKPSTPEQRKLLERVSKEYARKARKAGFKIKTVKKNIGGGDEFNMIKVYRRETPTSDFTDLPYFNKIYFEHLTNYTRIPMFKMVR